MCSAEPGGQRSTPGRWYQLTELIVVALEKGLAALLLLAGLLAAAGGIAAAVFLSSGREVGVVLQSKNNPNVFQSLQWCMTSVSAWTTSWRCQLNATLCCAHRARLAGRTGAICPAAHQIQGNGAGLLHW